MHSLRSYSHGDVRHGLGFRRTAYTTDEDAAAWADGPIDSVYAREAARPKPPQRSAPLIAPTVAEPPLEIACAGSFRIDLTSFVATFRDSVHAWQLNLDGQSDQLTCRELRLYFGAGEERRAVSIDPQRDPAIAQRQKRALASLQPRRLEAVGDPVKIDSPTRDIRARGRSLTFDFRDRRLTLDGGGASIARGANLIESPLIRYEHPPLGSPDAIGRMWLAGPGRLLAAPSDKDSARPQKTNVVEARWAKTPGVEFPVTLLRDQQNRPQLTIVGRPRFNAVGVGELTAERLIVSMIETAPDGRAGPAIELGSPGSNQKALLLKRVDADGRVEVESPRLSAATDTLTVWVRGGGSVPQPAAAQPAPARTGAPATTASSVKRKSTPSGDRYRLTARRAELDVAMADKRAEPTTLRCNGMVDFRELTPEPGEQPMRVRGERLRVDGLGSKQLKLSINGAATDAAEAMATITARGVTLNSLVAHLDQATNRLWADGPGDAHLKTTRDLFGQKTNAATDLHLEWKGGWVFDGQRITIRDDVFGQGPHDWVRTNELVATLARPITLGKSASRGAGGGVEIAQIDCRRGVTIDHRTIDDRGQTSQERTQLKTLSINQQTGVITGDGPGWVRSVRLSKGGNPLAGIAPGQPPPPKPAANAKEHLRLLRVHFQTGIAGNYKTAARRLTFQGRVRAIYGPVIAWQQDLPVIPDGALPPDTATLACDQLQVSEDPMARYMASAATASKSELAPIELIAVGAAGSVRMEGSADDGTVFNAQATRASFNQLKELFVLEGNGQTKATLWVQKPGEGALKYPAGKISYWRSSGKVLTDSLGSIDFTPTATRPAAPRPGTQPR